MTVIINYEILTPGEGEVATAVTKRFSHGSVKKVMDINVSTKHYEK